MVWIQVQIPKTSPVWSTHKCWRGRRGHAAGNIREKTSRGVECGLWSLPNPITASRHSLAGNLANCPSIRYAALYAALRTSSTADRIKRRSAPASMMMTPSLPHSVWALGKGRTRVLVRWWWWGSNKWTTWPDWSTPVLCMDDCESETCSGS